MSVWIVWLVCTCDGVLRMVVGSCVFIYLCCILFKFIMFIDEVHALALNHTLTDALVPVPRCESFPPVDSTTALLSDLDVSSSEGA